MEGAIVCTTGRNKRLYTFQIVNGKKVRVANTFARECNNVPRCGKKKVMCGSAPKLPCKKKSHIFNSKQDLKEYCGLIRARPKGEYGRRERAEIAVKATKEMAKTKNKTATTSVGVTLPTRRKKPTVTFSNQRTRFVNT